jgi:hypothetical protein
MTTKQHAVSIAGLYGTNMAIEVIQNEIYAMQAKLIIYEEILQELINLGTEETEQQ